MPNKAHDFLAKAPLAAVSATRGADAVAPTFCCTFRRGVGAVWVKAVGDLDLAAVPELDAALRDALTSAHLVVLDLSELSFIDLAGVRAIVDASIRAVYGCRRILVAFVPAHIERTLTLSGTAEAIERLGLPRSDAWPRPSLRLADSDSAA